MSHRHSEASLRSYETKSGLYHSDGQAKVWRTKGSAHDPNQTSSQWRHCITILWLVLAWLLVNLTHYSLLLMYFMMLAAESIYRENASQLTVRIWSLVTQQSGRSGDSPSQSTDLKPTQHASHLWKTNKQLKDAAVNSLEKAYEKKKPLLWWWECQ